MSNFEKEISEISTLRETKGKEAETLQLIDALLSRAVETKEYKLVAKLYWESHLVWQHTVMAELAKPAESRDQDAIKIGSEKMLEFAEEAKNVIEEHKFEDMLGGAYRFLGRAATYGNKHGLAKKYYETAIKNYSGKNLKSKLEVSGFLAEALVRLQQPTEGLALAIKTYDDYHNSKIGQDLKKEDYALWVIWMSGVAPRIATALLETGATFDKEKMKAWLNEIETELNNPSAPVTWGDPKFEFRRTEISSVLSRIISFVFVLIGAVLRPWK